MIKLQLKHKALYQSLQIVLLDLQEYDAITQVAGQVRIRLFSQLITRISRVLQKLLSYFNGTFISTFIVAWLSVWPVSFCLNLNELLLSSEEQSVITPALVKTGSSQ